MSKPCKQKSIQSGSGLLFKDKPFFTKTFKKAIGSEKKFMTAYASFARNSNRYFKILKEHIDNLEAVDKVMVNVLGEKGAFKEMFIRHVLGGDIRTGNIKINTKNPLLVKNYPLQSYTDVADLVESYLSSQVWFKLWEKFPQDENANVLVIFGENMRGKTCLLNALRWCFYGDAQDRQKKSIEPQKLINNSQETSNIVNNNQEISKTNQ